MRRRSRSRAPLGFVIKMGKELKDTKEHQCKFCVFIVGAGKLVRVIVAEDGRIIITIVIVP